MIQLTDISKSYKQQRETLQALSSVSLEVQKGEFVTFFGPNGSGKSTLFNLISGLDTPSTGQIRINGKAPEEARIGFVFQNYQESLFPWRTVLENVTFPLEIQGVSKEEAQTRAESYLARTRLLPHKNRYPHELSGGLKQLTAICRAMVIEPDLLMLDEPCSALDYATTKKVELEIIQLCQEKSFTTLCVSHDVDEAVFLADRVVVMNPRPGSVKEIIPIDLPRPRTLGLLQSPEFFAYRSQVLQAFMYE